MLSGEVRLLPDDSEGGSFISKAGLEKRMELIPGKKMEPVLEKKRGCSDEGKDGRIGEMAF